MVSKIKQRGESQKQDSIGVRSLQDQPKGEIQKKESNEARSLQNQPHRESQEHESSEASTLQGQPERKSQEASANDIQSERKTKEQKSDGASAERIQSGLKNTEQQNLDERIPKGTQRGRQRQQHQILTDVQVFMVCRQKNDAFCAVYDFLTSCGIMVKRYCMEGSDDFDFGSNEEHEISETLKYSHLMLLFDYKLENVKPEKSDPLTRFDWIVGYAQKEIKLPVYIIHNNQDIDVKLPDRLPWASLLCLYVPSLNVDKEIVLHNLMVDLFEAIQKHDFSDFKLIPGMHHSERVQRTNRKSKRKGTSAEGVMGAPEQVCHLFVRWTSSDVSNEDVWVEMERRGFIIKELKCKSHPEAQKKSFKLSVPPSEFNKLLNKNLWPKGVCVQPYLSQR